MILLFFAAVCLCTTAVAEGGMIGMPNPMREVSADEMLEELGISFSLAEGAENTAYWIIESGAEEDADMAQADYAFDGEAYSCRKQRGDYLTDISGMYLDWTELKDVMLGETEAALRLHNDEAGVILWYSTAYGMTCSVSMDAGATEEKLIAAALPIAADMTHEAGNGPSGLAYELSDGEDSLTIRLAANATTGYSWILALSDESMLRVEDEDYIVDESAAGLVGAGGTYVVTLRPTMEGAGMVTATFTYSQPWEELASPAATVTFDIWITEAGTLMVDCILM